MRGDYVRFLKAQYKKWNCNRVVMLGDLVDWASISYHPKAPSLRDSELEYERALAQVKTIYRAFPKVDWLIGNHDALSERQALDANLPMAIFLKYKQMWGVDGWKVHPRYHSIVIDDVIYQHGDKGRYGKINAGFLNAQDEHRSVVQGHLHAQLGVNYFANQHNRIFGMQVGCGVDASHAAAAYGKRYNQKPINGCGVVLKGVTAITIPMNL